MPSLPDLTDEEGIASSIVFLREVRRVARSLEANRIVTSFRTPRLLKEHSETLSILSGTRGRRKHTLLSVKPSRESSAVQEKSRDLARERVFGDKDPLILSGKLKCIVEDLLVHTYSTLNPIEV